MDTTGVIAKLLAVGASDKLRVLGPALAETLNKTSAPVFWRAILAKANERIAQGKSVKDVWADADLFMNHGLHVNADLGAGERPVHVACDLSMGLALEFAKRYAPNCSLPGRAGRLPLLMAANSASKDGSMDEDALNFIAVLASKNLADSKTGDQRAKALFELLRGWAKVCAHGSRDAESEGRRAHEFFKSIGNAGWDMNPPRANVNIKEGSCINTPLAFFIKALHQAQKRSGRIGADEKGLAENVVWALLENRADPALQLEKTRRIELLEIVRKSGAFGPKVASRLEASLLMADLDASGNAPNPEEKKSSVSGRRL